MRGWGYTKRLSRGQNRYGAAADGVDMAQLGECDWTVRVRWRYGLMSNYFDHFVFLRSRRWLAAALKDCRIMSTRTWRNVTGHSSSVVIHTSERFVVGWYVRDVLCTAVVQSAVVRVRKWTRRGYRYNASEKYATTLDLLITFTCSDVNRTIRPAIPTWVILCNSGFVSFPADRDRRSPLKQEH